MSDKPNTTDLLHTIANYNFFLTCMLLSKLFHASFRKLFLVYCALDIFGLLTYCFQKISRLAPQNLF